MSATQRVDARRVRRGDEHEVGRAGGELERDRRVRERGDHRLALRRAGDDRRALHAEEPSFEVDVVQLVAVDVAPGRLVLDDRVVLPAVPQPADDLDRVGRFVEEVADESVDGRFAEFGRLERLERAEPDVGRLGLPARHLRSPSGAPVADVVERGERRCQVERFGVGRYGGRHESDPPGDRADQRGDQHRVEAAADLVVAPVRTAELRRLQAERVLDGDEVEQAALGGERQRRPVLRGEDLGRARAEGSRQLAGWNPVPSRATARWSGRGSAIRRPPSAGRPDARAGSTKRAR